MQSVIQSLKVVYEDTKVFNNDFEQILKDMEKLKLKIQMKNTKFCILRVKWKDFNKIYNERKIQFSFTGILFCISMLKDIKYIFVCHVEDGMIKRISGQTLLKQFSEMYDVPQILFSPSSSSNKLMITYESATFPEYVRVYGMIEFY